MDSPMSQGANKPALVILIQNRWDRQAVNTWLRMLLLDLRPEFREMAIAKYLSLQ